MKLYCNIEKTINEDSTVTWAIKQGPCPLPECANNVSNLYALDDDTLKIFGWVPVEQQTVNETENVIVSTEYEITENCVIEKKITRNKTKEELDTELDEELSYKWKMLRAKRDELLLASDKLVLSDRWEKLTTEEKQQLSSYRQALRDLPSQGSDPTLLTFPKL